MLWEMIWWYFNFPNNWTSALDSDISWKYTYPNIWPLLEPLAPPFAPDFKWDDPPGLETLESDADRLNESAPSDTEFRRNPPPVCPARNEI